MRPHLNDNDDHAASIHHLECGKDIRVSQYLELALMMLLKVAAHLKQSHDQLFRQRTHSGGNVVLVLLDLLVRVLERLGLERWLPDEQRVHDAADGPDVDLVAVAFLAEDLRRDVVGCPAKRPLSLAVEVDMSREAEVANLDLE